ncbi:MAG TPA: DUF3883 domain-containing protein [Terriglobales bacterium]|jgi:hypothetical protein|nr:DUF3883 domain-containing protein [Terriglobales bacterium]
MIDTLAELNRVLLAVNDLCDTNHTAALNAVIELCKSTVIEGRIPDHEKNISFAHEIGFLTLESSTIRLTPDGRDFIALNPNSQYDLTEEQKRVLLRTCYLHGPLRKNARGVLKVFSPALEGARLRWSFFDSSPFPDEWTVDHLSQLSLVTRTDDGWEVSTEYTRTVSSFLDEGEGWSEEKFREYLKEKEEVGKLGETLVKEFERQRLLGLGHRVEAHCVRNISNVRVNAGYDLESFDGPSPTVAYDRFIEVKGARGSQLRFFWSENEITIAKRLGKRYWIYFQGSIDATAGIARDEPILLNDPVTSILTDGRFKTVPQGLIVESAMKGKPKKTRKVTSSSNGK